MTLRPQIGEVIRRANVAMFSLKKILPLLHRRFRVTAVGALVNSHRDYASALYAGLPHKDLKWLQRTQNQALQLATAYNARCPSHRPAQAGHSQQSDF